MERDSALSFFIFYFDFLRYLSLRGRRSLMRHRGFSAPAPRETFNLSFILFGTRALGFHHGLSRIVKISVSMLRLALRSERNRAVAIVSRGKRER